MKMITFAKRNFKEILRDPINVFFGLGFPVVLIFLLSAIQSNVPVSIFEIDSLAPGMTVFGLSFLALFSSILVSKDRESAFLQRLYTTPLSASDFIFGYILPLLPMALAQSLISFVASLSWGLEPTVNILYAVLFIIPSALFFISFGLLCGSVFNSKQVGGICGALLTNVTAFLSGIWFPVELVGGVFKSIAELLPFIHAVELERAVFSGNFDAIFPHLLWVIGYTVIITAAAILLFLRQMKRQ